MAARHQRTTVGANDITDLLLLVHKTAEYPGLLENDYNENDYSCWIDNILSSHMSNIYLISCFVVCKVIWGWHNG